MAVVSISGRNLPGTQPSGGMVQKLDCPPTRKRILTLGGCNLHEAFLPFREIMDVNHLWRAGINNLVSPPVFMRSVYFPEKAVTDVVYRETTKVLYGVVREFDGDLIAFEAGQEFAYAHLKIGDTIIPDFRTSVFGLECEAAVFPEGSELALADRITTDDEEFWLDWYRNFRSFYEDVIKSKIDSGLKFVYLSRRLCRMKLEDGNLTPFEDIDFIERANERLCKVEQFVSSFEGVIVLRVSDELLYSSPDAPWKGPWPFHPENGYYAELRQKLLRILDLGDNMINEILTQERKARDTLQSEYRALVVENENKELEHLSITQSHLRTIGELQGDIATLTVHVQNIEGTIAFNEKELEHCRLHMLEQAEALRKVKLSYEDAVICRDQLAEGNLVLKRELDASKAQVVEASSRDKANKISFEMVQSSERSANAKIRQLEEMIRGFNVESRIYRAFIFKINENTHEVTIERDNLELEKSILETKITELDNVCRGLELENQRIGELNAKIECCENLYQTLSKKFLEERQVSATLRLRIRTSKERASILESRLQQRNHLMHFFDMIRRNLRKN